MTFEFKSNIKCSACVEKITNALNSNTEINTWNVNTNDPKKILTIESDNLNIENLKKNLEEIGYKIEQL